jgi:hypothetical protein
VEEHKQGGKTVFHRLDREALLEGKVVQLDWVDQV